MTSIWRPGISGLALVVGGFVASCSAGQETAVPRPLNDCTSVTREMAEAAVDRWDVGLAETCVELVGTIGCIRSAASDDARELWIVPSARSRRLLAPGNAAVRCSNGPRDLGPHLRAVVVSDVSCLYVGGECHDAARSYLTPGQSVLIRGPLVIAHGNSDENQIVPAWFVTGAAADAPTP